MLAPTPPPPERERNNPSPPPRSPAAPASLKAGTGGVVEAEGRKPRVAPSWSDTVSGAATTDPSATLAEPPTRSRPRQPVQIAASDVSGKEMYRLPSYSAAARSERKLRHRWVTSVAPSAALRRSVDTT